MPLARGLTRRYRHLGIATEDLEQVAYLGLVESAERFDPTRGYAFTDFAAPTIRGELRKHFRDAGWVVRPPRRLQELQAQVRSAEADLQQELDHPPSVGELAERTGALSTDVEEALSLDGCFSPASLDAGGSGQPLLERQAARDPYGPAEARVALGAALRTLTVRDRRILALRYSDGLTQQEIGDQIGVTQMQVSRLLSRILRDLRVQVVGHA